MTSIFAFLASLGDTAHWDVHYAFFARNIGEVTTDIVDEEQLHLFRPEDITSLLDE